MNGTQIVVKERKLVMGTSCIQSIDATKATGSLAKQYKAFNGHMPNILKVQSLNPASLQSHYEYYRAIMFSHTSLSRKLCEMIALAVSAANECFY